MAWWSWWQLLSCSSTQAPMPLTSFGSSGRDLLPFHSPNSLRPNATPPSTWSSYWKTTYLGLCLGMSFNLQISIYFKISLLYLFAMKIFFLGEGDGGEEKNLERRNSVLVCVSLRMLQMKKKKWFGVKVPLNTNWTELCTPLMHLSRLVLTYFIVYEEIGLFLYNISYRIWWHFTFIQTVTEAYSSLKT